jgi:purine nucleosidase
MSFFSKIKFYIKKIAIYFLIISTIGSVIYTYSRYRAKNKRIEFSAIIDTDSGNGVSDLFVISRALADPKIAVLGLTSVQWNQNPITSGSTVGLSQEINDTLLMLFGREDIPHLRGSEKMINIWNAPGFEYSEAAEFIVKKANEATEKKKLNIITLGAMTNLASAILIDSTIVTKIRVYSSVMLYHADTKVWNKNEFNARNDLDALDLVLNTKNLEIHIMPVSISKDFELDEQETSNIMRNKGGQWDFIINNWQEKSLVSSGPVNWNIALIEAILKPDDIKEMQTTTPPENLSRQIYVYTWINKEFMKIDFHEIIKKYISDNRNQ